MDLAGKIEEIVHTGTFSTLTQLERKVPKGLTELIQGARARAQAGSPQFTLTSCTEAQVPPVGMRSLTPRGRYVGRQDLQPRGRHGLARRERQGPARRMADNEVGTLVIMDGWRPRQAVGILTDRDIAWHVAGIRHLVVPGEDNNVAGLLSLDDVLDVMVGETAAIGRLLERQKPRALRASAGADP